MKNSEFNQIITKIIVVKKNKPTFDESATEIEIVDEGAGPFIKIGQCMEHHSGEILIDVDEWEDIKKGVEFIIEEIKKLPQ